MKKKEMKECKHNNLHSWSDMEGITIYCRTPFCGYSKFIRKEELDKELDKLKLEPIKPKEGIK